jgi:hypothetical protein
MTMTNEQQRNELRNALYPNGCKHPQQAEWQWLIERVKEQREAVEDINEAAGRISAWALAYPRDIFTPPSPEQWGQAHEFFKTQGFSIDCISAEYGRRIVSSIEPHIEAILQAIAATKKEG